MSEENIHDLETDFDEEDSDETSDEEYDDESETDVEEDDDQTIVNNVQDSVKSLASLIAHNEAYQVLIIKLTKKVGQLLQSNRDQQRKLKQVINNGVVQGLSTSRVLRSEFNPPYFHDVFGMVPVANVESVAITNESLLDVLMREPAPWSNEELLTLRDAVFCQVIEKRTEEVEAKKQNLRYKIKNYHAEDGIEQLRKWKVEFEAVQRRLDYLKSLPIDELLENAKFEELDWARISVKDFGGARTIMQLKMKWMNDQSPIWNKNPWTEEEIESLKSITQSPWINWDFVSEKLKSKRSPFQCFEKFMEIQKQNREKRAWTTAEDEKLLSLIQTFKFGETINWNRVAAHMPGRNNMQCKIRYTRSLDRTLKRGRWGEAEDLLLTSAVNKYGPQDWDRIASQVPGRSSLQCRARWINCLDYKKRNAPWSVDEDEAVLVGVKVFGRNQFSKISKLLPGRNSYDIKNRVRTLLRWKIVALLECQGNRQSLSIPKRNDNVRIKKFGEIARLSNNMNKRGIMLHKRMGYGTFVVSEDGACDVDYSQMKLEMCNKFGYHYIARKGRWCRLAKNPNEYGSNELKEEVKRLPDDKKRILEKFLEEREDREGRLDNAEIDEDEEEAVMARVSQLMADNLEVDEKDIEWFHKNTLSRKLTTKKRANVNKALKSAKKRRRTSKRNAVRSDFGMYISDLAPTRYSVSDRMADEFCYNVNKLPKNERRGFILNQMADCVAREMDTQTKRAFAKLPREIPSTRVVDFLQKELSVEKCSLLLSNSSENPAKYTLDMKNLFSSVLPPAAPTLNCLIYFKEQVRRSLMTDALRLFTRAPDQGNIANDTSSDAILDIKLSEQISTSREYLVLKSRIFKLFLWPMILKKSLENGESIELRKKLRTINSKRRTELIKNMESKGLSVKDGAYQWDTVNPDPELFDKDPNDGLLKELNYGRPSPDYFNPKLAKKDVLESLRKTVKTRRKNFKSQPGTLGHVILGESMTIRAAPSMVRSYTPRWARTSNALFDVNMMKAEDVNKLTLKDLMLLDETERRKVASIIRSNAKKSQEPQAGSSNEP